MDVLARTLRSLEWERLKGYLADEASAVCSRERCLDLELATERALVQLRLDETSQALRVLSQGIDLSQTGLPDLREALSRLSAGAPLSSMELLHVAKVLTLSRQTKVHLSNLNDADYEALKRFAPELLVADDLVAKIHAVIDEDGGIRDDASPALRKLRNDVQRLQNNIKEELMKIINSSTLSKCLQEPLYTSRNGRYVLPVNASMRGALTGIVHDSSASGLTVYVEPMSVVELTNRIRLNESEIEREIDRLLAGLSAHASDNFDALSATFEALVGVDFIAARARLARRCRSVDVAVAERPVIRLRQARHPLLVLGNTVKHVVANDITLDEVTRTLVITGPNTGGKTVYLKTAGLLALMVRAGLLPPVGEGSSIGVFTQVFCDIGDEQSLEQNLSTFSSHMSNIVEIVRRSAPGTLVLLDEIGAGTDPKEGAILAGVILRRLKDQGALTITSTHYSDLKLLAHGEEGFANGGMQFDEESLAPTYKLQPGLAGSSKAFVIARGLGLDDSLVAEAKRLYEESRPEIELRIEELEERMLVVANREEELENLRTQMEQERGKIKAKEEQLQTRLQALKDQSQADLDNEYKRARKQIAELTAQLQKKPSLPKLAEAQEKLVQLKQDLGWDKPMPEEKQQLTVGQKVTVVSLNQSGVIEEIKDDHCLVRIGSLKVKSNLSDLRAGGGSLIKPRQREQVAGKSHSVSTGRVYATVESNTTFVRTSQNTLDVRGKRVDEAMPMVERFVDEGYLEHLSPLMIIHGHGTGAIRNAVRDYLSTCSYKLKYRGGEAYEGGDGVTIVEF